MAVEKGGIKDITNVLRAVIVHCPGERLRFSTILSSWSGTLFGTGLKTLLYFSEAAE
jgi:hypothetical protein